MKTVHVTVYGRVQGVGFRYFTQALALKMQVNGFVRNQSDGGVFIVAQASEEVLQTFIEKIKASPSPYGAVYSTTVDLVLTEEQFTTFEIRYAD